ncbi:10544_t:CDS:2, partial [Gigaspora rosea]
DPQNLEEATEIAEQVGAGKYYGKNKVDRGKTPEKKIENNINQLTRKMQQMSLNYAFLTSALAAQGTSNTRPRIEGPEANNPENRRSKPVKKFNLRSRTGAGPMQVEGTVKPPNTKKQRSRRQPLVIDQYRGIETAISTTYLDDQLLLTEDGEDSDSIEDLLEELEYEEGKELQKCEIYYSEEYEMDVVEGGPEKFYKEDNPAVYLTEIDPLNSNDLDPFNRLNKEERMVVDALLENNKTTFADNIAEEGQTLGLGCTNLTHYEIDTGTAKLVYQTYYCTSRNKQDFLYRVITAMEEKG